MYNLLKLAVVQQKTMNTATRAALLLFPLRKRRLLTTSGKMRDASPTAGGKIQIASGKSRSTESSWLPRSRQTGEKWFAPGGLAASTSHTSHGRRLSLGITDRLSDPPRKRKRAPQTRILETSKRRKMEGNGQTVGQAGEEGGGRGGDRTQLPHIDGHRS